MDWTGWLVLVWAVAGTPLLARGVAPDGKVLVVGATGGTGPRAVLGLLDVGFAPSQLFAVSRRPDSATCETLRRRGLQIVQADLDDALSVREAVRSVAPSFAYVHGSGGDTKSLDVGEIIRAETLAVALASSSSLRLVAYNSAAGEDGHGVERIRQKRECEATYRAANLPLCALRANLFMEELWKGYTRPSILSKKRFRFSVPPDKALYLTSVRDMGRLAATTFSNPDLFAGNVIDVASDIRSPRAMADAFGVRFQRDRILPLVSRILAPELATILRFYRTSTLHVDLGALRDQFPGLLTDFDAFLDETQWFDPARSYDTLVADVFAPLLGQQPTDLQPQTTLSTAAAAEDQKGTFLQ